MNLYFFDSTFSQIDNMRFLIDVDGTFVRVTKVLAQCQATKLEVDIYDLQHQLEGFGPTQATTEFVTTLDFLDTMLGYLSLFVITSQLEVNFSTLGRSQARVGV